MEKAMEKSWKPGSRKRSKAEIPIFLLKSPFIQIIEPPNHFSPIYF